MIYTVYALYSSKFSKIYIGYTSDIKNRLDSHNIYSTKGHTSKFRPWILVYTEEYPSKAMAIKREKQLKSAAGRKFIWELISKLN
ncbi:GIY-YIG nuclease family protein [Fulvivirga sp.]|uniref:GIY-YIG nuclease family protein n=1 Tax=Fulvivirga sp. TaxID=1931237 RepID=UPI0032EBB1F3